MHDTAALELLKLKSYPIHLLQDTSILLSAMGYVRKNRKGRQYVESDGNVDNARTLTYVPIATWTANAKMWIKAAWSIHLIDTSKKRMWNFHLWLCLWLK